MQEMQSDLKDAKNRVLEDDSREGVGIPYTLTMPFQGILLSFEWLLLVFFYEKENLPSAILFTAIFLIHGSCYAVRRYSFLRKKGVSLGGVRTLLPLLALAAVFAVLYLVVVNFIVPST